IRAVQANAGLTILPEATVRKECADGSLQVIACKQMRLARPLGVMVRRTGKVSRAADEFLSLLLGGSIESPLPAKALRNVDPNYGRDATAARHPQDQPQPATSGGTEADAEQNAAAHSSSPAPPPSRPPAGFVV